jgi:ribose/xylose/arabinose/galactoside ABC-type transport system permease subunit
MGVGGPYVANRSSPVRSSRDIGNGYSAGIPVPVVSMIVVHLVIWFVLERTPVRQASEPSRRSGPAPTAP